MSSYSTLSSTDGVFSFLFYFYFTVFFLYNARFWLKSFISSWMFSILSIVLNFFVIYFFRLPTFYMVSGDPAKMACLLCLIPPYSFFLKTVFKNRSSIIFFFIWSASTDFAFKSFFFSARSTFLCNFWKFLIEWRVSLEFFYFSDIFFNFKINFTF